MTEHFDNDAHDYLLHQMEPARRSAFEQELQRNPAATAALKRYADSLAGFACEVAGAETLSAADHQAVLAALAKATRAPQPIQRLRHRRRVEWRRFFWPVAAALLLLLNLIEFQRPLAPAPGRGPSALAEDAHGSTGGSTNGRRTGAAGPDESTSTEAGVASANEPAGDAAVAARGELERLRTNVAELQRAQERLRAEYDHVLREHAEQRAADQSLNRLATMELVDAASYARGERRGLVALGRNILTEPGVVIPPESGPPTTGASASVGPPPNPAYAWSVFDEKQQQGNLNLYSLPVISDGEALQVWVRPADAKDFLPVGEVPAQFYGGNGAIQYTLPDDSLAPAEILITVEPRDSTANGPTGATVLRGP